MKLNFKKYFKSLILPFKKYGWDDERSVSKINLLTTFPAFKPHGNQDYKTFEGLVIKNINEVIPKIAELAEFETNISIKSYKEFYEENKRAKSKEVLNNLQQKFEEYGSDKSKNFYHYIYSVVLYDFEKKYKILEIGMGTNNEKIISSMGKYGKPGASLRAFRDVYKNSNIFGADYDQEILFEEKNIKTYFVDQTRLDTFSNIYKNAGSEFDLIIDDGLHYQLSNINTLLFSVKNLKKGGYLIIEDIGVWTLDSWKIIHKLLDTNFVIQIIQMTESNFIFILKRI